MEENNIQEAYKDLGSFLKGELGRIDSQIKDYGYSGKLEEISRLWELRKDIVNEMTAELHKEEEIGFLKGELGRIDSQIKDYGYGKKESVNNKIELFKLRKIIVEEIKKIIKAEGPKIYWI